MKTKMQQFVQLEKIPLIFLEFLDKNVEKPPYKSC